LGHTNLTSGVGSDTNLSDRDRAQIERCKQTGYVLKNMTLVNKSYLFRIQKRWLNVKEKHNSPHNKGNGLLGIALSTGWSARKIMSMQVR
jgi:hypothetical protein